MLDMKGQDKRVFVRRYFTINNPANVDRIFLSIVCDGPFAAYINGIEVIRNSVGYSSPGQSAGRAPAPAGGRRHGSVAMGEGADIP